MFCVPFRLTFKKKSFTVLCTEREREREREGERERERERAQNTWREQKDREKRCATVMSTGKKTQAHVEFGDCVAGLRSWTSRQRVPRRSSRCWSGG